MRAIESGTISEIYSRLNYPGKEQFIQKIPGTGTRVIPSRFRSRRELRLARHSLVERRSLPVAISTPSVTTPFYSPFNLSEELSRLLHVAINSQAARVSRRIHRNSANNHRSRPSSLSIPFAASRSINFISIKSLSLAESCCDRMVRRLANERSSTTVRMQPECVQLACIFTDTRVSRWQSATFARARATFPVYNSRLRRGEGQRG